MFEQPCQRGHLPLNPGTLTIENKPVTISGNPSKPPNGQYKNKVEEQFNINNARSMWQGINNITDFKGNKPATVNIAASLPDELNLFLCSFRGSQHRPHRERPRGCCRRGECNLHFCRGCYPILQTGKYPQGCGSWWHPRPCAPSMRIPASWDFHRHFQPLPLSVCGSLMLQKIHHCAHTKEK